MRIHDGKHVDATLTVDFSGLRFSSTSEVQGWAQAQDTVRCIFSQSLVIGQQLSDVRLWESRLARWLWLAQRRNFPVDALA